MFDTFTTGDWHLGLGKREDTCVLSNVIDIIFAFRSSEARNLLLLGDIAELLKHKWEDVAFYNKELFQLLALSLIQKNGKLYITIGNHDEASIHTTKRRYYEVGLGGCIAGYELQIGPFIATHGQQFDFFTHGVQGKVAKGLTWFASKTLEKIPGVEERYINPTVWFSPAHPSNKKQEKIHHNAEEYAKEKGIKLVFGHTHYAFCHEHWLGNPGGLTKGHEKSYLLLDTINGCMKKVVM